MKRTFLDKVKDRLNSMFLQKIQNTFLQFAAYKSYWHFVFNKNNPAVNNKSKTVYIAQKPNYGAGIGHQLANWNTSYYFATYYKKSFAHFSFSNNQWGNFLGYGENETSANDLIKDKTFKKVKIPRFDSDNEQHIKLIGQIINSYRKERILFLFAMDQGYTRQCDTREKLSEKFFSANARQNDKLFYDSSKFNIALHVRRGDIVAMKENNEANGNVRWLDNNYYINVLNQTLANLKTNKPIAIYLFSQGEKKDFKEFEHFENLSYCLDTNPQSTFLHLVKADILISSKSSFSYKPALLSNGIKICPKAFWHNYPSTPDFILADDQGDFDIKSFILIN